MTDQAAPYLFLVPAVLAIAGVWGLVPGLVTTALGVAVALLVFGPSPLGIHAFVYAAIFGGIGAGASWLGEVLRQTRLSARASNQDALAREAHVRSILETIPDAMVVID